MYRQLRTDTISCGNNGIAVDADTGTIGIQTTAAAQVGDTFQVGIVTTLDGNGVAGFEAQVAPGTPAVLVVDQSNTATGLKSTAALGTAGLGCGNSGNVVTGPLGNTHVTCTAASGAPTISAGTQILTVDVTCANPGTSTIHLVRGVNSETSGNTTTEDATFGNSQLADSTNFIPLFLADASVTCSLPISKTDDTAGPRRRARRSPTRCTSATPVRSRSRARSSRTLCRRPWTT